MIYDVYRLHDAGYLPAYFAELWRKANGQPNPIQNERWLRQELKQKRIVQKLLFGFIVVLAISFLFQANHWLLVGSITGVGILGGIRCAIAVEAGKRLKRYKCVEEYKRDVEEFFLTFFYPMYTWSGLLKGDTKPFEYRGFDNLKPVITRQIVKSAQKQLGAEDREDTEEAARYKRVMENDVAEAKKFGLAHPRKHYYDIARKLLESDEIFRRETVLNRKR